MSRFLDSRLAALKAYVPGEQPQDKKYIKLNTNESPFPPAPAVKEELPALCERLRLYPDPDLNALRDELALLHGVERENILVGNGSDEVLGFAFLAFCGTHAARFADLTYGFYKVFADLFGVEKHVIPLEADYTLDVEKYMGTDDIVFIANPNAPTGIQLDNQAIRRIVESTELPVIIDEAYVDFGKQSCAELVKQYDNLLVVRTFSKSRNLAGGRIGWAVGSRELINDLNTVKYSFNPYNVNTMSQCAAICALKDKDYFEKCVSLVKQARHYTQAELKALGFTVIDSDANFIFAAPPSRDGRALYLSLKDRGILVRYFDTERTKQYVRITVGTCEQMQLFIKTVKELI
ncbi:MAG: histidinol-phosphate transaminase [Clostridia bacterium]|nr:histidinol-phosphate transaminase [Clostridia bacterium]